MSHIAITTRLRSAPGRRDDLVAALALVYDAARDEEGTLVFAVHRAAADPDLVCCYELFRDEEALQVHRASPAVASAGARFAGLVDGQPEVLYLTPVLAKGLPGWGEVT